MASDETLISEFATRVAPELLTAVRFGGMWDLDEIFWKAYRQPWDLPRALTAFRHLVTHSAPWMSQLVPTLVLNLPKSPSLDPHAPDLSNIHSLELSPYQPPALGFGKVLRPSVVNYEYYRVPVAQQLVAFASGDVSAYYECWRTMVAREQGEFFDRGVVFQYWSQVAAEPS